MPPLFAQLGVKTDAKVFKKIHLSSIIEYVGRGNKVSYLSFNGFSSGGFGFFPPRRELSNIEEPNNRGNIT